MTLSHLRLHDVQQPSINVSFESLHRFLSLVVLATSALCNPDYGDFLGLRNLVPIQD